MFRRRILSPSSRLKMKIVCFFETLVSEDGDSMFVRNFIIYVQVHTWSQSSRKILLSSPLWEPQISRGIITLLTWMGHWTPLRTSDIINKTKYVWKIAKKKYLEKCVLRASVCLQFSTLSFEAEVHLNNTKQFSPYRKKNTTLHHYKDQLVNAVLGNNPCLHWESYETHKYKMKSYWLLKQVGHIVTIGL
jgi:hypothetical protein